MISGKVKQEWRHERLVTRGDMRELVTRGIH